MLRVVGAPGDPATRIENRLGESAINPYLCMAVQVHAGLSGMALQLEPSRVTDAPNAGVAPASELRIPGNLGGAVAAFRAESAMQECRVQLVRCCIFACTDRATWRLQGQFRLDPNR